MPNGDISRLFKRNIIISCKDYKYVKDVRKEVGNDNTLQKVDINLGREYNNFTEFETKLLSSGFTIPDTWDQRVKIFSRYGYFDSDNDKLWLLVKRGNSAANYKWGFEIALRGHTPRVGYDTLENRLDEENNPWQGHSCWNIINEPQFSQTVRHKQNYCLSYISSMKLSFERYFLSIFLSK